MAGEVQLNSVTALTESSGSIVLNNVDSATNRTNLGLAIGSDVQEFDSDTTKNDVANTFSANQTISVTDNTNAALSVTQLGTGNALIVNDEGSETTPFVIDASGKVGIGTNSPQDNLHIVESTTRQLRIEGNAPSLYFKETDGSADQNYQLRLDGGAFLIQTNNDAFTAATTKLKIDSSGNLLVNTDSVTTGGSTGKCVVQFNGTTGNGIKINDFDTGSGTDNVNILFQRNNSTVGKINTTSTTTSLVSSSDYRLKENISTITDGIARVLQLNPSRFNFIVDPDNTVDGFIAHEVSDIVPQAVSGDKDAVNEDGSIDPQGIDQSKLIPLITAALQESISLIESQQSQINALTERITALETT